MNDVTWILVWSCWTMSHFKMVNSRNSKQPEQTNPGLTTWKCIDHHRSAFYLQSHAKEEASKRRWLSTSPVGSPKGWLIFSLGRLGASGAGIAWWAPVGVLSWCRRGISVAGCSLKWGWDTKNWGNWDVQDISRSYLGIMKTCTILGTWTSKEIYIYICGHIMKYCVHQAEVLIGFWPTSSSWFLAQICISKRWELGHLQIRGIVLSLLILTSFGLGSELSWFQWANFSDFCDVSTFVMVRRWHDDVGCWMELCK